MRSAAAHGAFPARGPAAAALNSRAPSLYASSAAAAPELSRTLPGPAPAASAPGSWLARALWVRGERQAGRGRAGRRDGLGPGASLPSRLPSLEEQVPGPGQVAFSARPKPSGVGGGEFGVSQEGMCQLDASKVQKGHAGLKRAASPSSVPKREPSPGARTRSVCSYYEILRTRPPITFQGAPGAAPRLLWPPFLANPPVFSLPLIYSRPARPQSRRTAR